MGYLRQGSELGEILCIQMDQHQQVIGSHKHFLELNSDDYLYGEPSHIQFLWGKNTKRGITLLIDGVWKQEKARVNDKFLMDKIK